MDERIHKLPLTGDQINELRHILESLHDMVVSEVISTQFFLFQLERGLKILETQQ